MTLPCVAAADAEGPLRDHVYAALNSGAGTPTETESTFDNADCGFCTAMVWLYCTEK